MDRTVPKTGGEEIQLYMRTYYSLLRSSETVQIETLAESHIAMQSSLHVGAGELEPDTSALIYSALRLPACFWRVDEVIVGQIEKSFVRAGYEDIAHWERVFSPGRRRRMQFDGDHQLAVFIVSRSDIDDLVPILVAYQIEWNKLHVLLQDTDAREYLDALSGRDHFEDDELVHLSSLLKLGKGDLQRLQIVWQGELIDILRAMADHRKSLGIKLISGSLADYRRATAAWWDELLVSVLEHGVDPEQRPVYFVSSNTHSLINLLTGFAHRHQEHLVDFVRAHNHEALLGEYEDIQRSPHKSLENFLYYILGKYMGEAVPGAYDRLEEEARQIGIHRVPNKHGFQIEAQIIEIGRLESEWLDPRLNEARSMLPFADSDALILNIDYPLGVAAYEILSRITERIGLLQGVYVMGKAATLNGRIGDVMIPNVMHDEHSQNTYLFDNCFSARDVKPFMSLGNVLDNQKAVTALGTFLQNPGYMSVFYREGYTDIEMEGGPYLSAIYEAYRPQRHPINEIVNLYQVPFDIGVLHYASDTPMKKGQNLGAGSLNYTGVEPTYATAIAILQRIFHQEAARLANWRAAEIAGLR